MPRRNRRPGYSTQPGRLYHLEDQMHDLWNRMHRRWIEQTEREETRRRYENLRNKLTRQEPPMRRTTP